MQLEVFMLLSDLHGGFEKAVELGYARSLTGFLDYGGAERGQPSEEPVVLALHEEHLHEVGESHQILLVTIVIRDVLDDHGLRVAIKSLRLGGLSHDLTPAVLEDTRDSLFDSIGQVELVYVLHYTREKLIINLGASELSPDLVLRDPVPPELDGVLQTLVGGLSPEDHRIRDLQGLCEGRAHEFLIKLYEGRLVMSQGDCEVGKSLIEAVSVLWIEFPVMADTERADLKEMQQKCLCRLLMPQVRQNVGVGLDE